MTEHYRLSKNCSDPFYIVSYYIIKWVTTSVTNTVCPGSSDPPEKIFNIFASEEWTYSSTKEIKVV